MKQILSWALILLLLSTSCTSKKSVTSLPDSKSGTEVKKAATSEIKAYQTFENDPTGLRLYTLENGLKVYLSKNTDEPKIETLIAVKAGSTYDPKTQTGLAHYLEHMLFKGTSKIGTADWEKEKVLLQQISDLYQKHLNEANTNKKEAIYRKIDSVSNEASKYAIANEYDKMISSIGAEGTNAFTSNEMTVYKNKIPSGELKKWLKVEKERFSELTLRLFHTELETVYEEFNRGQDNDNRKQYQALMQKLFPTHPYGTQTTIGTSEHLKNPSMEAIHEYFDKYYVPNNMAMILVGDINFDTTIAEVKNTFGDFKSKPVEHPKFTPETPITSPIETTVFGPSAESLYVGFRAPGATSKERGMIELIDYLLANSTAGLIDLNLNSKQKVQRASSYTSFNKDYGMHILYGSPKKDQSLDELKELLLSQLELIKKGEFDDWLIGAVVNDLTLTEIKKLETTEGVAFDYLDSFINEIPWEKRLQKLDELKKITKQQVVDFANNFYKDNYVAVYKKVGEDPNQVKVKNPKITPVTVNRDQASVFTQEFNKMVSEPIQPQKIDYKTQIKKDNLTNGIELSYIENTTNDLASLTLIFPIGSDHDKLLANAFSYANYLGTDTLSSEEIKKEFYKIGIQHSFQVGKDETKISVSGLQENIPAGLKLVINYLQNLKVDANAYQKLISRVEKSREDTKKNKGAILWQGLVSFSQYGENSRLRNTETIETLKSIDNKKLITLAQSIFNYKPEAFYYGNNVANAKKALNENYLKTDFVSVPEIKNKFIEKDNIGNVYFVDYDMVQAELLLVSKSVNFSPELAAGTMLFNSYFGSGLSSIVFQELRESKSLAYAAMSRYSSAQEKDKPNYLFAYMGTQANKLSEAVKAMKDLLNDMPKNEAQFNAAKESVLKTIAAKRINKAGIYWNYDRLQRLGIDYDNREEVYNAVKKMTLEDLDQFFETHIKGKKFDMMVLGNKKDVDLELLKEYGPVKELEIDYLFNF